VKGTGLPTDILMGHRIDRTELKLLAEASQKAEMINEGCEAILHIRQ
jgi:hypothetical protein